MRDENPVIHELGPQMVEFETEEAAQSVLQRLTNAEFYDVFPRLVNKTLFFNGNAPRRRQVYRLLDQWIKPHASA